jgi:hypothetical protein
MQESITQFCVLAYDEMNINRQYKEKANEVKDKLEKCKEELRDFAGKQGKSCIPVTFQIDGEEQKLYLRFMEKMTSKSINLEKFKNVVGAVPPVAELQEIFQALQDPNATLSDVYGAWLYNALYKNNTIKKQTFEISASCEKQKKGEKGEKRAETRQIHIPDSILKQVASFAGHQNKLRRLGTMKTERIAKINEQKEKVEPTIQAHFQSRPIDKQFHKISMEIDGQSNPWFVRRVVKETKPSSISLAKVKPLIFRAVEGVISTKIPFDARTAESYFQTHQDLVNSVFFKFRLNFEDFKKANVKVTSVIQLADKEKSHKRKKRDGGADEDEGDDNDGHEDRNHDD